MTGAVVRIAGLILFACYAAASDTPSSDSGTIELLKFPFPYRAAVSVNSDIDGATVEKFNAVHELVNRTNLIAPGCKLWNILFDDSISKTLLGKTGVAGFGLPLADSMWFYDADIGLYESYDYATGRPVPHEYQGRDMREVLDEWLRKGWIDTVHAPPGDIRREAIHAGLTWLHAAPHRRIKVWVNHSMTGTPANIGPCTLRALPLLLKNSFKAVPVVLRTMGASRLADAIPIPKPYNFPPQQRTLCWAFAGWLHLSILSLVVVLALPRLRRRLVLLASLAFLLLTFATLYFVPVRYGFGDTVGSPYYCADLAREHGFQYYWLLVDVPSCRAHIPDVLGLPEENVSGRRTFLRPFKLNDGAAVLVYPRCYKGRYGTKSLELLDSDNLEALCRTGGTAIIYTHWTSRPKDVFTLRALKGLRLLQEYYEQGKVWVAPTSQLLDFTFARSFLNYSTEATKDRVIIKIHGIDSPVKGPLLATEAMLEGISFSCPRDKPVSVFLGDEEIPPLTLRQIQAGDRTIVQIPLVHRTSNSHFRLISSFDQAGIVMCESSVRVSNSFFGASLWRRK